MFKGHRILVTAHGHPDFSIGGGEVAAYNLYNTYKTDLSVSSAWFLARSNGTASPSGSIIEHRDDEFLWDQSISDWHQLKATNRNSVTTSFVRFMQAIQPTIVHAHHYAHLGLEYLRIIKRLDPKIFIMMTLHEFMAICKHNGQMIKKNSMTLCEAEDYVDCHQCFPQQSAEDFWLRKHFILNHFNIVDQFIAPSNFLRDRYIGWGIAPNRITVIENGQADEAMIPPRILNPGETKGSLRLFWSA